LHRTVGPSKKKKNIYILVYRSDVVRNWPGTVNSITHSETEGRTGIEVSVFEMYKTEKSQINKECKTDAWI